MRSKLEAAIDAAQSFVRKGAVDARPSFLFRLLLETGIKKGEAARLTPTDFDQSNPQMPFVWIRHKLKDQYKERKIDISSELLASLEPYLEQYQLEDELFDCTPRNLEYVLTDVGERAGIPFKLSFEVMRWTFAVRRYRLGEESESIREKMGLSKISWYETSKKIEALSKIIDETNAETQEAS